MIMTVYTREEFKKFENVIDSLASLAGGVARSLAKSSDPSHARAPS